MNIFEDNDEIKHYSVQNLWGDVSIDLYFRRKVQNNKTNTGLSGYSICDDQHTTLNYVQVQSIVDKVAQQLLFTGLNSGDILALQLPNSVETQILYLACWQQGITVAPLPSLWREKDIKQALIRISPRAFISPILHDGYNYTDLMYQVGFNISSIKFLFSLGGNAIDGCLALDEFFADKPKHDIILLKPDDYPKVDANSTCLITFSKDDQDNNTPLYHTHNHLIAAANIYNSLSKPSLDSNITSPFPPTSMAICAITIVSWLISEATLTCYDGFMATEFQNIKAKSAILCLPKAFDEPDLIKALLEQGLDKLVFIGKITDLQNHKYTDPKIIDVTTIDEYAFIPQTRHGNISEITAISYEYILPDGKIVDSIELAEYETETGQIAWQISCSFLPTNSLKTKHKFNSDLLCDNHANHEAKLNIGNMALNYIDIERDLLKFHGVEDAAILAIQDNLLGLKPVIAIVPKVGAVILHHEIVEFLKNKQIAAYKIPQELYKIPNIPRDYDNHVLRLTNKQELLELVGPKNKNNTDGLLAVQQELATLLANA